MNRYVKIIKDRKLKDDIYKLSLWATIDIAEDNYQHIEEYEDQLKEVIGEYNVRFSGGRYRDITFEYTRSIPVTEWIEKDDFDKKSTIEVLNRVTRLQNALDKIAFLNNGQLDQKTFEGKINYVRFAVEQYYEAN